MKTRHGFNRMRWWLVGLCLVIAGCSADFGYDDTGGSTGGTGSAAWLTIDPEANPNTHCNTFELEGEAFISPTYWHCCGGTAKEMTAVTVTWRNETTGATGDTYQTVQYGFLTPLYNHRWSAMVSLALGDNLIAVTAADPKISAVRRIVINRAAGAYSAGGRLRSINGAGIGTANSGVLMAVSGPKVSTVQVDPVAGYQFECLFPGRYTATPAINSFDYVFTPASLVFDVGTQNVTLADMVAPAYRVLGQVWYSGTGLPAAATSLQISSGTKIVSTTSDANGNYEFVVPNGSYRVDSPSQLLTPSFQNVTVSDADVPAVNFSR